MLLAQSWLCKVGRCPGSWRTWLRYLGCPFVPLQVGPPWWPHLLLASPRKATYSQAKQSSFPSHSGKLKNSFLWAGTDVDSGAEPCLWLGNSLSDLGLSQQQVIGAEPGRNNPAQEPRTLPEAF